MVHPVVDRVLPEIMHHRVAAWSTGGAVVAIVGGVLLIRRLRRVSPEEMERQRRLRLMADCRAVDGMILDWDVEAVTPVVMYTYRVSGVEYSCSQDLSALPDLASNFRVDLPVQVRYDKRNPGNSIVAAEGWSGLRGR